MNIFYLDKDPELCAKYHCDKHVVKMILEYAQLLSTAHRIIDGFEGYGSSKSGNRQVRIWTLHDSREEVLYKATHVNHPSNIWTRQSAENYMYLWRLWHFLCKEYVDRYKKDHVSWIKLGGQLSLIPDNLDNLERVDIGFTNPPQCMPDEYKDDDTVIAYRNFYNGSKSKFAKWQYSITPHWFHSSK